VLRGELLVRGPQVFQGYWNHPDATAHTLLDVGWLRTGDVVLVDETGRAVLVDRIKEMIITGGFKVYPSQVEDQLRTMPGIRDVAVVGVPGRGTDENVAAVVVLDEAPVTDGGHGLIPHVDLESLRAWGAERLARYALPKSIAFVSELPRSQIGKVLRRVVRANLLAGSQPLGATPTAQGVSAAGT
jgi:long-chain acyl-CoA synthetase